MILVLTPLIVTIILFTLFETTAYFENIQKGIKLGGAAAAYLIFFTTGFVSYKKLNTDPLDKIRKSIAGHWECISDYRKNDEVHQVKGKATISVSSDHKVSLLGNIENHPENWEADEVVLTESKLVYFFEVPVMSISGVANLRFIQTDDGCISTMQGYWILAGQAGRGNVTFKRLDG